MPDYRFTETSENELDEIWTYLYLNASERIANRQVTRLKDSFRLLAHHPDLGRSRNDYGPGIRRHNVTGTPYYVSYVLLSDGIEIVRILHGRQEVGSFLE